MLPRHHVRSGPDVMCKCTGSLDQISDVKGMALAWCDSAVSAEPTPYGLAFDVLGNCTTKIGDIAYTLQKVCLLLPSAHRSCRHPSPLEVQFVHETECGDRLVLAVLFHEGEPSPDVYAAFASLVLEQAPIRLINLFPLGRRFFVHDVSDRARGRRRREIHMISDTEKVIAFEQLAELSAKMASHPHDA